MTAQDSGWDNVRCARLGFLVGIGWDAGRIAKDPTINTDAAEVHRQVVRMGLGFRQIVAGAPLNLSSERMAFFDAEARMRRLPTEALLRKVCEHVADERLIKLLPDAAA